jgi:hypothetical protein
MVGARARDDLAFAFGRLNLNATGSNVFQHETTHFIRHFHDPG